MRLIIREYLSMLKESGELDALIPDLLLSMDITPVSRAQVGPRQYGVDIAAVGRDPDDHTEKLFLLTVKQGDIDRNAWNGSPQAVQQSLDDIRYVYLQHHIDEEHRSLPKKVIVCCGGNMKQTVEQNWRGYKGQHTEPGVREYDLWDGDKLAVLIERHLMDEYLFPETAQKQMRKTIALADQNEDEPRHFYTLIHGTLFERDLPTDNKPGSRRKRQHALRLLNLSLNIVFHWCQEADNLRPALLCAERTVLLTWDWMRQEVLFGCRTTREEFESLLFTHLNVVHAYVKKLAPLCMVRDGLFGWGADELEYPLRTFEVIGILSLHCMALKTLALAVEDDAARRNLDKRAQETAQILAALIANNPVAATPRYDGHAIDVALGLLALANSGLQAQAAGWIENLTIRICVAYQLGRDFPISTDSYDDLVAMNVGEAPPRKKLMELSTLLPTLAHWHAVLDLPEPYEAFRNAVTSIFSETDLQLWFPDESTEQHLYRENAGRTGVMLHSIQLPETLAELKALISRLHDKRREFESLSCFVQGWPILGLIASRHFRTPVIPAYWQEAVNGKPSQPEQEG
jgi:hypothetical protein